MILVLSFGEERDLIRQVRSGDERAKNKLYQSFHRTILKIASKYSGPTHAELMAAGSHGFWEAVQRFNLTRNSGRLRTYADSWIRKRILEEIERRNKDGDSSDTRADRWIYSHPNAAAEEVVAAVGGSLRAAEAAIQRALAHATESYDTTEGGYDEDDNPRGLAPHGSNKHFTCFNDFQSTPQILHHRPAGRQGHVRDMLSGKRPRWPGYSRIIDCFAEAADDRARRRLKEIGRRAYALELVAKEQKRKARVDQAKHPGYLFCTWLKQPTPTNAVAQPAPRSSYEVVRRAGVAHKLDQHPWRSYHQTNSELWKPHRPYDPANLRTASESRQWQKRNWKFEPNREFKHDIQNGKRRSEAPRVQRASISRRGNGNRSATGPHVGELYHQTRAGERSPNPRSSRRESGLI
jgi:RNA polymerase sigma factor (sigma-70 family)